MNTQYDDLMALRAIQDSGYGAFGQPVLIDSEVANSFLAITGPDPFGSEVSSFLLVGMVPVMAPGNSWKITGHTSAVNLGCPKIQFISDARIGDRVCARSRLARFNAHRRGVVITYGFDIVRANDSATLALCENDILYMGDAP